MKTAIFIVSCAKHYPWLDYALQSIGRFAKGFHTTTVLVPRHEEAQLLEMEGKSANWPDNLDVRSGDEWPDKGMLWHMAQIFRADQWCPEADFILHTDSDCLFTEPVMPEDYFVNGKPVLMHASFKWLINTQQANLEMWQRAAEAALGWKVLQEFMRRHPAVHPVALYSTARQCVESHTKKSCDDYIKSCENGFPQTFAEFPTLGAVAWKHFRDHYHWIDQQTQPFPYSKLTQFWSHQSPDLPQSPVYKGKPFECTPRQLLELCASAS